MMSPEGSGRPSSVSGGAFHARLTVVDVVAVTRRFDGGLGRRVAGPAPVVNWEVYGEPSARPGLQASFAPVPIVTVCCVLATKKEVYETRSLAFPFDQV